MKTTKGGETLTKYTTIGGDTWDMIAKKALGSELVMDKLIKANVEYKDVVVFSSGVVLNVPKLEQLGNYSNLPPWKRGGEL